MVEQRNVALNRRRSRLLDGQKLQLLEQLLRSSQAVQGFNHRVSPTYTLNLRYTQRGVLGAWFVVSILEASKKKTKLENENVRYDVNFCNVNSTLTNVICDAYTDP